MANEYILSYTAEDINTRLGKIDNLAEKSEMPKKLSDLTNDSNFATESYVNTQIVAVLPEVSGQISDHNTATDAHNDIRLLIENKADVNHVHSYNDLEDKPEIVTETTPEDIIEWMSEENAITPVASSSGQVYLTNDDKILIL